MNERLNFFRCLALVFVIAGHSSANAAPGNLAPESLAGMDVVLTIEQTESALPGGYPTTGAVVQTYYADGTYEYQGVGGLHQQQGTGTYSYATTGRNTAEEQALQTAETFTLPYVMEYTFETRDSGKWIQYFADGLIVFEGSFVVTPSQSAQDWVPFTLEGSRLSLRPDLPRSKKLELDYAASTFQTVKPGAKHCQLDGQVSGSYQLTRMSARSAVEEGTYADSSQYVRIYTWQGHHKGRWYEKNLTTDAVTTGAFQLKTESE